MKNPLILFLLLSLPLVSFAQIKKGEVQQVKFILDGTKLNISYDLISYSPGSLFKVKAVIIDSSFKKQDITISNAVGEFGEFISPGNSKNIQVDLLKTDKLNGIYKIDIVCQHIVHGGPANALLSAVIPGLGNIFVHNSPRSGLQFSTVLLLTGVSLMTSVSAQQSYDENMKLGSNFFISPQMRQDYIDKANMHKNNAETALYVGAAVWATDIILVAVKGFRNQSKMKRKVNPANTSGLNWHLHPVMNQQSSGIGLSMKYHF